MIPKVYGISEFPAITGEVEFIHEIAGSFEFYSVGPMEEKIMYGYYTEDYPHSHLEIINIDGSNKNNIGEYMKSNIGASPIFNPKGTHILYYNNSRIAMYDIGTTQTTYVSQKNITYPTNPDYWVPHKDWYSWDGYDISDNNIVFSFNGSIFVSDYQGTYENAIYSGRAFDPRFSHDGSKIIFTTHDELGFGEYPDDDFMDYNQSLHIIDMNGTNHLTLAKYSNRYSFLNNYFNYDDSKIYFTVEVTHHPIESDNGIWVVNINGSGLTKLI